MKKLFLILFLIVLLTGCTKAGKDNINFPIREKETNQNELPLINENNTTKTGETCFLLEDLPNEYGCLPSMSCNDGEVCREGLCLEAENAPNEYGCHPSMYCDSGEVCRNGLCVNEDTARDAYGCSPTANCNKNQVCRSGVCYTLCAN